MSSVSPTKSYVLAVEGQKKWNFLKFSRILKVISGARSTWLIK
jgi:hypothetical protein